MTKLALLLLFSGLSLLAKELRTITGISGEYRVTATLSDSDPVQITALVIQRGKQKVELPSSLFNDIVTPHIGVGYEDAKFRVETKRGKLFIRITAGGEQQPDDHALVLTLPLKEASRITREGEVTGYTKTHPAIPIIPNNTSSPQQAPLTTNGEQDGVPQPPQSPAVEK